MDSYELGSKIAQYRQEKNISQKELGDILGVSNKAVSKWENGESLPKTATLVLIAELMDIDVNDLVGVSKKKEPTGVAHDFEMNRLKAENVSMKTRLDKIDKRKKRNFITAICVCIVGIILSSVIVFSFSGDAGVYNKSVSDAGKDNTKITFSSLTFYPATPQENYILSNTNRLYTDSEKYAAFTDAKNNEKKVLIKCDPDDSDVILLQVKTKKYYYLSKEMKNRNMSIGSFGLVVITSESKFSDNEDDYGYRNFLSNDDCSSFEDYYNSLSNPVDKRITELYLGNKPKKVSVFENSLSDSARSKMNGTNITVGEFFKDDKDNAYFYDYVTTKAYPAGKEMTRIVYQEN